MAINAPAGMWGTSQRGARSMHGVSNTVLHRDRCPEVRAPQAAARRDHRAAAGRRSGDVRRIGFTTTSIEDICHHGGFTHSAFYSSFRSKDELFARPVRAGDRPRPGPGRGAARRLETETDPVTAAVERCLSTFRADRTWVLVHTEYSLHAARHPEAAAALRRHAEGLHRRLTALIESATARMGLRLTLPAHRLARIVLALHDGVVIRGGAAAAARAAAPAGRPAPPPTCERTALLLLLRSATTD